MGKRKKPLLGKPSAKSIRFTLNTLNRAMRRVQEKGEIKNLLKLAAYRDRLLEELAAVETAENAAQKRKEEIEAIRAQIAEARGA